MKIVIVYIDPQEVADLFANLTALTELKVVFEAKYKNRFFAKSLDQTRNKKVIP